MQRQAACDGDARSPLTMAYRLHPRPSPSSSSPPPLVLGLFASPPSTLRRQNRRHVLLKVHLHPLAVDASVQVNRQRRNPTHRPVYPCTNRCKISPVLRSFSPPPVPAIPKSRSNHVCHSSAAVRLHAQRAPRRPHLRTRVFGFSFGHGESVCAPTITNPSPGAISSRPPRTPPPPTRSACKKYFPPRANDHVARSSSSTNPRRASASHVARVAWYAVHASLR